MSTEDKIDLLIQQINSRKDGFAPEDLRLELALLLRQQVAELEHAFGFDTPCFKPRILFVSESTLEDLKKFGSLKVT